MEDNNNNDNLLSLDRSELIDRLMSANAQVHDLTIAVDNLRDAIVNRDQNVVNLKDKIRSVVDKFRSALIEGDDVTIDDWDALQEYFDDFDGIADLAPPTRTVNFSITMSTTFTGRATVTDPSLDESDVEELIINSLDTSQHLDLLPDEVDGVECIEHDYYIDFDIDDSNFDLED